VARNTLCTDTRSSTMAACLLYMQYEYMQGCPSILQPRYMYMV
jgi:hypothetical protein